MKHEQNVWCLLLMDETIEHIPSRNALFVLGFFSRCLLSLSSRRMSMRKNPFPLPLHLTKQQPPMILINILAPRQLVQLRIV